MNILFSGGSTGFGKTIVENLRALQHEVVTIGLNGDIPFDYTELRDRDWSSPQEVIMEQVRSYFDGPIHVLVNNAGLAICDWLEDYSYENWAKVIDVNLNATFALSSMFVRHYVEHPYMHPKNWKGRIINTSSMGATIGLRCSPAYCAAKAGVEALTKTMAKELAGRYPITVMAIAPGGVDDTVMQQQVEADLVRLRGMTPEEAASYNRQSPLGRNMTHEELWDIYEFAIFKAPEYLSGSVIKCTGGMGI